MDCPQCRRECGQNDKFCSECGYRLCSARTPVTELSVPGKETGDSTDVSSADLSRVRRNSIDWTRPNLDLQPRTECTATVSPEMEEGVHSDDHTHAQSLGHPDTGSSEDEEKVFEHAVEYLEDEAKEPEDSKESVSASKDEIISKGKKITMATSNQIVQVTKGLTKEAEFREDTKLLMQPYANWEEYLTPAPMSIAILAELVFISSNTDFSIRKGGPEGGFKYIKYPDSFRACLMQVCNFGWRAFNDAHKNMDQICLYTNNVPNYIKLAVQILLQDGDNIVQTMLPDQLDNISNIADECVNLAQSTEKRFTDVIELIQELLETCTSAKPVYGNELEEVRKKMHENELRKMAAEEATSRAELAFKNKSFESAMNSMEEKKKELTEILVSLRNCAVKEIDFTTNIKILAQDLQAMGNVKDQWQKLIRFFQMVSNLIKSCLGTSLNNFAKTSETVLNRTLKYTSRMFLKDIIYNQAFYASNIASLVNMIAGTYVEVSDKYLMDGVSKLSMLMSLEADDPQLKRERQSMADSCKNAEEGIRKLVKKNKQDFERKTRQRQAKIESELKAVLPPESEEKKRERKEVVEKASKNDQDVNQYA